MVTTTSLFPAGFTFTVLIPDAVTSNTSTSSSVVKMVEVVLFEVKQHKYKLVLGWVIVPWVVLLIDRSRISQEPNAGTLLCYDHDLSLIPGL